MKKQTPADEPLGHPLPTTPADHDFELLYQRYLGKVYQTCLSLTNDTQAFQDISLNRDWLRNLCIQARDE